MYSGFCIKIFNRSVIWRKIESYSKSWDTFKCFVLNALCSKAKQLRIVLRHGIIPNFLEIHLLLVLRYTLYKDILCIEGNLLETRENIKIESHPFYHIVYAQLLENFLVTLSLWLINISLCKAVTKGTKHTDLECLILSIK